MKNRRFVRAAVRGGAVFFAAFAALACFIGDTEPRPGTVVVDAQAPVDTGVVNPVDTGVVDSGPATGPACRGDLDCTQGVRTHCILDPGRPGFCVQCAPEQGFTCAEGLTCTGGVCVEGATTPPITGPACTTDAQCTGADRPRCVPSGAAGGARVCAQCDPSIPCVPGSACASGICVGQGALRVTLTWDRPGDVDLHVVTPGGREIYYGARTQDGGDLDRDDTTGTGPENVFWASSPPSGTYLVCVVPFRVSGATNFTLSVVRTPGGEVTTARGSRAESTGNQPCSRTSPHFVTEFRY